jgi:hypothetical protein
MAEVIIVMSPAKSHHMSRPLVREHISQLLLRQQRECQRLKRRKLWQRGVWVTARMPVHAQGQRQCNSQTRYPSP